MMRRFRAIAVGAILLAVSAGGVQAQSTSTVNRWVVSNLPSRVTVQSAAPAQLAAAVIAAIRAHPKEEKAIVVYVFSQFTAGESAQALAVIDAIVLAVPADEVAGLIKVAIGSLSVTIDLATGQSAQTALASLITQRAIADDPALTSAILAAIGAAPPGTAIQVEGPGGVTNPANSTNTTGPVSSAQRWVASNLPQGVTIKSATPAQLAAAVIAAIRAHPKEAKAIVAVPADQVAGLIKVAIGSLSVTIDPATGQSAQSALGSLITQRAIADDPGLASAILAAIGAAAPGPAIQVQGPGGVTNPANFTNTTGPVNSTTQ